MKIRIFLLAFSFVFTPTIAYAFPLADSAGTISTLIGVIASLIFAVIPSTSKNKKKIILITSVVTLAFLSSLGSALFYYKKFDNYDNQIQVVRQSRPDMQLNNDVIEREKPVYSPLDDGVVEFVEKYRDRLKVIPLEDWKNQSKDTNYQLIIVGYRDESMVNKPYSFKKFPKGDEEALFDYLSSMNKKPVLYSYDINYTLNILKKFHQKTENILPFIEPIVNLSELEFSDSAFIESDEKIFSKNVYDLRNDKNIRETHTIVNAQIFTKFDLALTPNWKLLELFNNKEAIFTSYYEDYKVANAYLAKAGVKGYRFLKGGLQEHFETQNLTPNYYNNRVLEPELVNSMYAHGDQLRFICMAEGLCLDNLPKERTYVISYRDMERNEYFDKIRNLPKEHMYITVSSNQETAGLAIMTGYELIRSGHNYLGELPAFSRFSLEEVRHYIGEVYTYDTSLSEFQKNHYTLVDFSQDSKAFIDDYGWLIYFLIAGVLCRTICFPLQFRIYQSYYRDIHVGIVASLAGLFVPVFIIFFYMKLDSLISNYAIIDHLLIDNYFKESYEYLKWMFIALVVGQSIMSFPKKPAIYLSISALIVGVYSFGYMDLISLPMMTFLICGEIVSIAFQTPFYISYKKEKNRQEKGWALKPIKNGLPSYPEKWEYLANSGKGANILISTEVEPDVFLKEIYPKIPRRKIIIRSSSTRKEENKLGGYFESYKCDDIEPEKILDIIRKMKKSGCDYCFIQEYFAAQFYGVSSSLSSDGSGIYCAIGEHTNATEGASNVSETILDRSSGEVISGESVINSRKLTALIKKLEKKYKTPVLIEFGVYERNIRLLQIREQTNCSALCFFPYDRESFVLAEEYLAISSYTNGSILELITKNDFVFADGFMYRKKKTRVKGYITEKGILANANDIISLAREISGLEEGKRFSKFYWMNQLRYSLSRFEELYKASQSIYKGKRDCLFELPSYSLVSSKTELDVAGVMSLSLDDLKLLKLNHRDFIHNLICLNNYIINKSIANILDVEDVPHNIDISMLLEGSKTINKDIFYSNSPLSESDTDSLSPGIIKGEIWLSSWGVPEKDGYVLIGEEIASDWVRNLTKFSGVISRYGNENSHLAISARQLGIPYRKVSSEQYNNYVESRFVNL